MHFEMQPCQAKAVIGKSVDEGEPGPKSALLEDKARLLENLTQKFHRHLKSSTPPTAPRVASPFSAEVFPMFFRGPQKKKKNKRRAARFRSRGPCHVALARARLRALEGGGGGGRGAADAAGPADPSAPRGAAPAG